MDITSILKASLVATIGLIIVLPCGAQTAQSSPARKRRTVYTAPPTGSLLGGGYVDAGDSDASKPNQSTTLSMTDKSSFRTALSRLDAQSGTVVDGYALLLPAVKLQTGVPTETLKRQREATGLTFGELLVANSLASGSGKSFNDIIAMKNKGQSWSEISQHLRINIDSITARLKSAEESIKYAQSRKRERRNENVGDAMRDLDKSARPAPGS
jgi:hypothetical protein